MGFGWAVDPRLCTIDFVNALTFDNEVICTAYADPLITLSFVRLYTCRSLVSIPVSDLPRHHLVARTTGKAALCFGASKATTLDGAQ